MIAFLLALALSSAPLPNPDLTPGAVRQPILTVQEACTIKWGKDHRAVTTAMKLRVYHAYGFTGPDDPRLGPPDKDGHRAEVDHLFSRENGGADSIPNLWPEPYSGPWNAHDKDRLENALHADLCGRRKTFAEVWAALSNWPSAYVAEFGGPPDSAK